MVTKIHLYPYDYSQYTAQQQMEKVLEEIKELEQAAGDLDDTAEEAFDVIQSLIGYLITLGVDVEIANWRHMEKLDERER